jgi:hypothetical protein
MQLLYSYKTRRGTVYIRFNATTNRYHVLLDDDDLGDNHTPHGAVDDVANGHTFSPSNGVDTSTLGIPDDLGEWVRHFR